MESALPPVYRRILLKLSGELLGSGDGAFDRAELLPIVEQIRALLRIGVRVAIVFGGGNIYRGCQGQISREIGDRMGMLATVINGLALRDIFEREGIPCLLQNAFGTLAGVDPVDGRRARDALEEGRVVFFAGGTGIPFFSTDTAAALRAIEIHADALLKATKVDGIYDSDPAMNPNARRFERISFSNAVRLGLRVMDAEAFCMCRAHSIPIVVFPMWKQNALLDVVSGKPVGSVCAQ
ncbi:MAG: UMP kinase [Puniceicoccales bacterium]|jgi:uridylate kinase|nr:UMP kinase [Puniceicoccales bacterium]